MCACQLEIQRWTEESVAKIFTAAESGVVCRVQEEERESRAFRGIYSCGSDVKGGSLKSLARVRERERRRESEFHTCNRFGTWSPRWLRDIIYSKEGYDVCKEDSCG